MIIGHKTILEMLGNAASSGKMHHALLFWGPFGIGKVTTALEIARILNCKYLKSGKPCDTCNSCRRLAFPFPFHTDVRLLREFTVPLYLSGKQMIETFRQENAVCSVSDREFLLNEFNDALEKLLNDGYLSSLDKCIYANPEIDIVRMNSDRQMNMTLVEKYENRPFIYWMFHKLLNYQKSVCYTRSIKIDTIREIQKMLYLYASESCYKVVIIDDADQMLLPAQNSLLKMLEEPPENSLIILIVKNPKILLPTIRSRCQTIPFYRLSIEELSLGLQKKFGLTFEDAETIAPLAKGNYATALGTDWQKESLYDRMFNQLFNAGNLTGLAWIVKASNDVFSIEENSTGLEKLYQWLHDKVCLNPDAESLEGSLPNSRPLTVNVALQILDGIADLLKKRVYNLDMKLQFETMLANTLKDLSLNQ
jgi:DNA polymerase III delta prime subunit